MKKLMTKIDKNKVSETHRFSISEDGKIVSRLYIRDKQDQKPVEMFRLKTGKSYQRKGFATQLINSAIEKYKNRGLTLRACGQKEGPSTNTLIKIYRKFGFKRKGQTKTMYIDPPRKWKKGDRTKTKCPNCGNRMTITPISYMRHYTYGDGGNCSTSDYDELALQCKKCKLSWAGNGNVRYKGFTTNYWTKNYSLKQWINEVNEGKGKHRIHYY